LFLQYDYAEKQDHGNEQADINESDIVYFLSFIFQSCLFLFAKEGRKGENHLKYCSGNYQNWSFVVFFLKFRNSYGIVWIPLRPPYDTPGGNAAGKFHLRILYFARDGFVWWKINSLQRRHGEIFLIFGIRCLYARKFMPIFEENFRSICNQQEKGGLP
jgi:hypothetical protein